MQIGLRYAPVLEEKMRILVVEDEVKTADYLCKVLPLTEN